MKKKMMTAVLAMTMVAAAVAGLRKQFRLRYDRGIDQ